MHEWKGNFVTIKVPDDIYEWPAHRREIENKAEELEKLIHSVMTGATETWPC